jgi:hypothetical protein
VVSANSSLLLFTRLAQAQFQLERQDNLLKNEKRFTDITQVIVGISVVYIMGYNGMVASYAWLCGGEFPSQRLRSYTFGLAASIGFFGAWLATFTAPYFINPSALNWGPKYGYIWAPSCFIGALWAYFYLPEVKNRTFEEIDEMVSFMLRITQVRLLKIF